MTLRRRLSPEEQDAVEKQQEREKTARELRAQVERLQTTFSLAAVQEQLPFPFPTPVPDCTLAPFRARSWYTYPGWTLLTDTRQSDVLSAFYVVLHLIDFSPPAGRAGHPDRHPPQWTRTDALRPGLPVPLLPAALGERERLEGPGQAHGRSRGRMLATACCTRPTPPCAAAR